LTAFCIVDPLIEKEMDDGKNIGFFRSNLDLSIMIGDWNVEICGSVRSISLLGFVVVVVVRQHRLSDYDYENDNRSAIASLTTTPAPDAWLCKFQQVIL